MPAGLVQSEVGFLVGPGKPGPQVRRKSQSQPGVASANRDQVGDEQDRIGATGLDQWLPLYQLFRASWQMATRSALVSCPDSPPTGLGPGMPVVSWRSAVAGAFNDGITG